MLREGLLYQESGQACLQKKRWQQALDSKQSTLLLGVVSGGPGEVRHDRVLPRPLEGVFFGPASVSADPERRVQGRPPVDDQGAASRVAAPHEQEPIPRRWHQRGRGGSP